MKPFLVENLSEFKFKSGIYLLGIKDRTYIGSAANLYDRLRNHMWAFSNPNKNIAYRITNRIMYNYIRKYGIEQCSFNILEFCNENDLLEKEKHYIKILNPNCNFKLDPTTQTNCLTTSKPVYQFDLNCNFVKKYKSVSEAYRITKITGISHVANTKTNKNKSAGGYLWTYKYICPKYTNNSKLSKIKPILMIDTQKNITFEFKSIADCARYLIDNYSNRYQTFDSLCASISSFRDKKLKTFKYLNYIIKNKGT